MTLTTTKVIYLLYTTPFFDWMAKKRFYYYSISKHTNQSSYSSSFILLFIFMHICSCSWDQSHRITKTMFLFIFPNSLNWKDQRTRINLFGYVSGSVSIMKVRGTPKKSSEITLDRLLEVFIIVNRLLLAVRNTCSR